MILRLRAMVGAIALVVALAVSAVAHGQTASPSGQAGNTPADKPAASVENLQSLAKTLEDPERRQQLISQIEALIAAQQASEQPAEADGLGARMISTLAAAADALGAPLRAVPDMFANAGGWVDAIADDLADPETRQRLVDLAVQVGIVLFAGLAAEWAARGLLTVPRRRLEHGASRTLAKRVLWLTGRTVLDLLPLAAFAAATYGALTAVESTRTFDILAISWLNAYVAFRAIVALGRALTAPAAPSLRLVPWSDGTSSLVLVWARRFAAVAVFGYFAIEAAALLKWSGDAVDILGLLIGLTLAIMAVRFIFRTRQPVERWIRTHGTGGTERDTGESGWRAQVASLWPVFAVAYVIGVFAVWLLDVEDAFVLVARASALTLLVLGVVLALVSALGPKRLRGWIGADEPGSTGAPWRDHVARSAPVVSWVLRAGVVLTGLIVVLQAWSVDILGWINQPVGQTFVGSLMNIGLILVAAAVVWELVTLAIEHYLTPRDAGGAVIERSARARTLLPLLRRIAFIALGVIVALMVLAELGVSIGPLLAGAGVIGLAVGFGAQKLVQDVINGAFILFEDAVAVGDVVNVAGTGGLVESISIRTIRLRDLGGNLHTIPFSSVETVTNMTKDFSYYLLDVGVAYREDTDQVTEVIKEIVEEMRREPEFASKILEPLEVLGVDQFADSAVIIKARIKTKPIQQWSVGRAFNRRMKRRFDELGIEIPFPHQTIYFGVDKNGDASPARIETIDGDGEAAAPSPRQHAGRGDQWPNRRMVSSAET